MSRIVFCLFLLFLATPNCTGQMFHWPASYAVDIPRPVYLRLKEQVQVKERWGVAPDKFTYLPVFNVLHPTQRSFTDGIYYNTGSVHDSGRLFIYLKGQVFFLRSWPTTAILQDYLTFLNTNPLPDSTQVQYLDAITAFQKFQLTE